MAEGLKQTEMPEKFRQGVTEEHEHRMFICGLLAQETKEQAGIL